VSRSDFVDWLGWLRFRGDDCIAVNRRLWLLAEKARAVVTASQRHYKQDTLVLVTEPATAGDAIRLIGFLSQQQHRKGGADDPP
jgi:hypothetical protein